MYGHEDMINYLSTYRTQDKMRGVHYYPKGALCWFETNQYGDPIGSVYFIKSVPDQKLLNLSKKERGYQQLLKSQKKQKQLKALFTEKKSDTEEITVVKPKLHTAKKGEKQ